MRGNAEAPRNDRQPEHVERIADENRTAESTGTHHLGDGTDRLTRRPSRILDKDGTISNTSFEGVLSANCSLTRRIASPDPAGDDQKGRHPIRPESNRVI